MTALIQAMEKLRELSEPVPVPIRLPSEADVTAMEQTLGVRLHPDLKAYLLNASDVTLGTIEPATITDPESYTHLPNVIATAREVGVPDSLFPFCESNGDFFCLSATGEVFFWSHNGIAGERWPSLGAWIKAIWIGEYA